MRLRSNPLFATLFFPPRFFLPLVHLSRSLLISQCEESKLTDCFTIVIVHSLYSSINFDDRRVHSVIFAHWHAIEVISDADNKEKEFFRLPQLFFPNYCMETKWKNKNYGNINLKEKLHFFRIIQVPLSTYDVKIVSCFSLI